MAVLRLLVSYPKSGNTWVRILLSTYQRLQEGKSGSVLSEIRFGMLPQSRELIDDFFCIDTGELPENEQEILKYRYQEYLLSQAPDEDIRIAKSHDTARSIYDGRPLFSAQQMDRAVHIVRHPCAVAVSLGNHFGIPPTEAMHKMLNPSFAMEQQVSRGLTTLPFPLGRWDSYVCSWLDDNEPEGRVITVRYEDLHTNGMVEIERILTHLDWQIEPNLIEQSLSQASFENLQSAEAASGFSEKPLHAKQFFNKGKPDHWRSILSDDEIHTIESEFAETMTRCGYELSK